MPLSGLHIQLIMFSRVGDRGQGAAAPNNGILWV